MNSPAYPALCPYSLDLVPTLLHVLFILLPTRRLLSSNDLKVQEAVLTGESTDVSKRVGAQPLASSGAAAAAQAAIKASVSADSGPAAAAPPASAAQQEEKKPDSLTPKNEVFASTKVTSGEGRAVVFSIAMQTRVGAIALMIKESGNSTRGHQDEGPETCGEQCEETCAPERLCGLTPRRRTPL